MDGEWLIGICIGLIIVFMCGAVISIGIEQMGHEYINITGKVLDKYEDTYTTMVPVSNGKTTTVIPVINHKYVLVTDKGNLTVDSSIYRQYNNGSRINLTKDVNDSSIMYNGGT